MGGTAIKNTSRLVKKDFNTVKDLVEQFFVLKGVKTAVPLSYKSKSDFGDLDIVIENTGNMKELIDEINVYFNVTDFYKNGTIYSFGLTFEDKLFQVDLIFVTPKDFESSYNYLCYNDLFNLLGRLAHKLGFKLGHDGLSVVIKNGDYLLGQVILTRDLKTIFEILDVSLDKFNEGFNTPEEIFDFVIASKHFNSSMFRLENLNNINRVRNAKRKLYMQFVEYTKDIPVKDTVIDKEQSVFFVLDSFPEAQKEVQKLQDKLELQRKVAEKFNGNLVKELTGLEGKDLGDMMKILKSTYTNDDFLNNDLKDLIEKLKV